MVSIIIPSYKDPFLQKTIDSLLTNARGKIEILAVLDGYIPNRPILYDSRLRLIQLKKNQGMRAAINAGIAKSKGKFIMKCDSHCAFAPGFDKIMTKYCQDNWLMIPRRYSLDEVNWTKNETRPVKDYHYLSFPTANLSHGISMSAQDWPYRGRERSDPKYDIDDTMIFQGSCWFANRKYFISRVGLLDDRKRAYGPFGGEQVEIGLKYWLGGDAVKVVKKTWYAHLSKRKGHYRTRIFTRAYKVNPQIIKSRTWTAKHWMENREPGMKRPLSWLVEKFWPVPTWPEDRGLWVFPKG